MLCIEAKAGSTLREFQAWVQTGSHQERAFQRRAFSLEGPDCLAEHPGGYADAQAQIRTEKIAPRCQQSSEI